MWSRLMRMRRVMRRKKKRMRSGRVEGVHDRMMVWRILMGKSVMNGPWNEILEYDHGN